MKNMWHVSFMKNMEHVHAEINLKGNANNLMSHAQNKAMDTYHLSSKGTERKEWRDAPCADVSTGLTNPRNALHNSSHAFFRGNSSHVITWDSSSINFIGDNSRHDVPSFSTPEIPVLRADRVDLQFCKSIPLVLAKQPMTPQGFRALATTLKPLVGKGLHQQKVHEKWSKNLLGTLLDLEPSKNMQEHH